MRKANSVLVGLLLALPIAHRIQAESITPGVSIVDYTTLALPAIGTNTLHVLTPTLLELKLINTKQPDPARVSQWDLVDGNGQFIAPAAGAFTVTANGQPVAVTAVGFKASSAMRPL